MTISCAYNYLQIEQLEALPEKTAEDLDSIGLLKTELSGQNNSGRSRGSLDVMRAAMQAKKSGGKLTVFCLSHH
jgi:hypothetical protein